MADEKKDEGFAARWSRRRAADAPKEPRPANEPGAYLGVGAILEVFGVSALNGDGNHTVGALLAIAGAVLLLIGAIQIGTRRN